MRGHFYLRGFIGSVFGEADFAFANFVGAVATALAIFTVAVFGGADFAFANFVGAVAIALAIFAVAVFGGAFLFAWFAFSRIVKIF